MRALGQHSHSVASQASAAITVSLLLQHAVAAPHSNSIRQTEAGDPFAVIDPQEWVNPSDMTWADFVPPPGTSWANSEARGSERNFNIALVLLDYPDQDFVITKAPGSNIFGNPQPIAATYGVTRENVSTYYHDYLNKPSQELNYGHTLHEWWMEDSFGKYGVELTPFGPYRLPAKSYQYGIDEWENSGACPANEQCALDLRQDAYLAWSADAGDETVSSFELVFFLAPGEDESATWQEFGEMKFQTKESITPEFGPPNNATDGIKYAGTRNVEWTSWASAATLWPDADYERGNSIHTECSGMATFSHELSHILQLGDNYNNPYGIPLQRSYTGPWSMMSRGSFNGPGGPHTRWHIPALQGSSMGSLHTVHDKRILGLIANESVLTITREDLRATGLVVANLTARSVDPTTATGLLGLRIDLRAEGDLSPACDVATNLFCDGGGYESYEVEVVDRMGADSFQGDHGVMISKTKEDVFALPFQWTIDANPQDIELVDFTRPNGSMAMVTMGDYRQLLDALFHAGTRSGSEFEFQDTDNGLAVYVVDVTRDAKGVLSYTVAVRAIAGAEGGASTHGVAVAPGVVSTSGSVVDKGKICSFDVTNTGSYTAVAGDVNRNWDLYRLNATVEEAGWKVEVPNALVAVPFGSVRSASVAVVAESGTTASTAVVQLSVSSESDPSVVVTAQCQV